MGRLFAVAEAGHGRALALLTLVALLLFAPGFMGLPPMDRDEPRFAQATKQMLETGDAVDIRFQGEARHKKPVGIYWMQAAAVSAAEAMDVPEARTTIWIYRLPSLLGALFTVWFTYLAAAALTTRRAAFVAGLLMASTILLGVEARLAKTDAVVAATVAIGMAALARAYLDRDLPGKGPLGWAVAFWLAMGVGVLVKGPITPAVPLLASLMLVVAERQAGWLKRLRPGLGLVIFALIVAPWFVAIFMKTGGAFFSQSVGQDMLGKVAAGQESHGAPPGTYLAAFFGTAWPLAPFVLLAIPFVWHTRWREAQLFCLAWLIPMWIVFEAVPTKLPHYVLPLYPALAILVALAMEGDGFARRGLLPRIVAALLPLLVLALGVGVAGGLWYLDKTIPYLATPVLLMALIAAVLAWRALFDRRDGSAAVWATVASLAVAWGVYALAVPLAQAVAISPRLAAAAQAAPCRDPALATVGYREPSLVFLGGTGLAMPPDGPAAAAFMAQPGCRVVFIEKRFEEAFLAALPAGDPPRLLTRVPGLNLNGGRRLDMGVYVREKGAS